MIMVIMRGDVVDSKKHGKGIWCFNDGRKIEGKFIVNNIGEGILYLANNQSILWQDLPLVERKLINRRLMMNFK